jgi:hypothetical protein
VPMRIAAIILLSCTVPAFAAPDCVLCRDELKKELEVCKSEPAEASQGVCRESAARNAKKCEEKEGVCNFDLLMAPAKQPSEPTASKK